MSKVVFVNGFGNGSSSTERVGNALGDYYEDVEAFRFSDLIHTPEQVRKASVGANVITHSAGALALRLDSMDRMNSVLMFGPPLPQSISRLLYRTVVKTVKMSTPGIGINSLDDLKAAGHYSASSVAELIANPIDNFARLPEIAKANAFEMADMVNEGDIPSALVWTRDDAYFQPSQSAVLSARLKGIGVMDDLPGEHDEIVLRPHQVLPVILNETF